MKRNQLLISICVDKIRLVLHHILKISLTLERQIQCSNYIFTIFFNACIFVHSFISEAFSIIIFFYNINDHLYYVIICAILNIIAILTLNVRATLIILSYLPLFIVTNLDKPIFPPLWQHFSSVSL